MTDYIAHDPTGDGIDRRGFLNCMVWAGTGIVWSLNGGVPKSLTLQRLAELGPAAPNDLFFAQISDSHIGFSKEANKDVTATLQLAVDRLNALPRSPAFVLHTGDISQLSKPEEFDTAQQVIAGIKTSKVFYAPGEHDVLVDNGAEYLRRFGNGSSKGWYSFDHTGVHFVSLVNVLDLKAGGLGFLGDEQLAWLKKDLSGLGTSTPIVVFAHIPLWTVYPEWGWGTDDSAQALALLARFGSVTVLNGHIHQVMQKVEGHVHFHTAMSTAFPQPAPGTAPSPGPMRVEPERLRSVLGYATATFQPGRTSLAVVDSPLVASAPSRAPATITISNFSFTPKTLTARVGDDVRWTNDDDVPHVITSANGAFQPSKPLDTKDSFTRQFKAAGTYPYFCSVHPKMTGVIVVK